MIFLADMILKLIAEAAEGAAVFSAGIASLGGMYEPLMPENLKVNKI